MVPLDFRLRYDGAEYKTVGSFNTFQMHKDV